MSQKPSKSLILNYESGVISTTAKEASSPITAVTARIMDFHRVSDGSRYRGHPYCPQSQHRIQTSAWPLVAAQTVSVCSLYCLCFPWHSNLNPHVLIFAQTVLGFLHLRASNSFTFLPQASAKAQGPHDQVCQPLYSSTSLLYLSCPSLCCEGTRTATLRRESYFGSRLRWHSPPGWGNGSRWLSVVMGAYCRCWLISQQDRRQKGGSRAKL